MSSLHVHVLRFQHQQKDFLKFISNLHINTHSFLFIGIETTKLIRLCTQVFPRKPYPNSDQNRQSLHPLSDQNGAKTIPFGAAHTYEANIRALVQYSRPSNS